MGCVNTGGRSGMGKGREEMVRVPGKEKRHPYAAERLLLAFVSPGSKSAWTPGLKIMF